MGKYRSTTSGKTSTHTRVSFYQVQRYAWTILEFTLNNHLTQCVALSENGVCPTDLPTSFPIAPLQYHTVLVKQEWCLGWCLRGGQLPWLAKHSIYCCCGLWWGADAITSAQAAQTSGEAGEGNDEECLQCCFCLGRASSVVPYSMVARSLTWWGSRG